ncbi:Retrotransposon gag domain [Lasallia pustulata]|uniref:Retrotransposon gag domain n=1 Tax=Lasallia pustulata TaxID=136370 RepID=A0A1W5CYT8_9LECA|nr:Retrotransposon gag domain [Lasallia pustulata]
MVPGPLENVDQAANTAAKITTVAQLQHWAHTKPQAVLDEMNQVRQYHDDTVMAHNELIDQLQASAKGVEALEHELQELGNDYEKQTDDLLQTQSQLDQAQKQIRVLKADNAAKMTCLQAFENNTEAPRPLSARQDSPANSINTLSSQSRETKIQDKLEVNADYYPTALSQIAYIASCVEGDAAEHIHGRRRDGATKPYTSVNELLEHLAGIYEDQDVKLTAQNAYKNLRMGTTESFATFYSNFARITSMLPYDEHTLMDDLKDRLVQRLQDALALCGADFEDMTSLKAYLQQTDKAQHSLYLQRQNDRKESSPATSKSKDSANLSQTTTATRPTLAAAINVPSAVLNRALRGSSSDSPPLVNPVGSGAQCDEEGSGAESTGDVVVVAAATGKKKRAGVGRSLVGRPTKRVQGLFVGDTTDETNSSPEWCREDDLLPARVQQARHRGHVIRLHPDHTLLWPVPVAPHSATLVGSAAISLRPSLPQDLGGLVALPRDRAPIPEELEAALVALSESVSNALRALNAYRSCRRQERLELLVQPGIEGVGSQAPPDSDDRFASAEED